jgi:CRISPR-associated endonuclease Csn1
MEQKRLAPMISKKRNCELYDLLTQKYSNGIWSKRPNPLGGKLSATSDNFYELELFDQCKVLMEILKSTLFGIASSESDLRLLGHSKSCGVMTMNKVLTSYKEVLLVNQSITGIYESRIDLLRV